MSHFTRRKTKFMTCITRLHIVHMCIKCREYTKELVKITKKVGRYLERLPKSNGLTEINNLDIIITLYYNIIITWSLT